jgi:hypothetical protein
MMRLRGLVCAALLLSRVAAHAAAPAADLSIEVSVVDTSNQPVSGVRIELKSGESTVSSAVTGQNGQARFTKLNPGRYRIAAIKDGFETAQDREVDLSQSVPATIELTLIPALARRESVEVKGTAAPVDQGGSAPTELPIHTVTELPGRPATAADALPMLPGVVRDPGGSLILSGAGEHRSALIVNSADVTDPATGQFGLTVPIDSVETLNFYQTPFLAEYGRFGTSLVSVETRRGGDKWKWELNDPFPDFRIRSYHMQGLKDATPRVNVEGPLIEGKLYFSEGLEYEMRKTEVFEQPFPYNQKKTEGFNSFAQIDWIASSKHLVTATFHIAPQRLDFVNMDAFNPAPVTPDASTHNYTATLADRLTIGSGLLENTFSATRFDARVWGQGTQDLIMMPQGNTGDYYAQQSRNASRLSWTPAFTFGAFNWLGTHNFKVGSYMAESTDNGQVTDRLIDILNADSQLIESIAFTGGQPFRRWDTEYAFFGQDHWIVGPRMAIDLGIRAESQQVSESFRVAPRVGVAWNIFPSAGTMIRAGFGLFYDRVPLNVYAFNQYPSRVITLFDPNGQVSAGPFLYQNGLGTVNTTYPFVFQESVAGNFSPRSATGSLQIEQPLTQRLKLRVGYMQSASSGLVIMNTVAPDPATNTGAYLLSGTGQSRYRQFEVTTRVRLNDRRELFFSYVRSRARGDFNDFSNYLGSFPVPIFRNNQFGNLPTDLPNRFLAWGLLQLPQGFRIAPVVEYRSGFPYAVTDAYQNYVGVPYANRFPGFFSLDARFSKDIKVNPKYTIRPSISVFNLTDHFNPEALRSNIADPAYGFFFGQRGRRFTADLDFVF